MPVICIGPVCVPLNLFLPFLIGVLHRYGYLKWFKTEWVTFKYWGRQIKRLGAWWRGEKLPSAPEDDAALQQDVQKADKAAEEVSKTDMTDQSIELRDMKLPDPDATKEQVAGALASGADAVQQAKDGVLRQRGNAAGSGGIADKAADIASYVADKVSEGSQAVDGKTVAGDADPWSKDWWAGMAKAK